MLSQPVHGPSLWGGVRLLCSRAGDLGVKNTDLETLWAETESKIHTASSPCAFSGPHLAWKPFRYNSTDTSCSLLCFQCGPRLQFLLKLLLEKVIEQKGMVHRLMHCGTVSARQQSSLFVLLVFIFCLSFLPVPPLFVSLCKKQNKCLSKNIYVQFVVWPSKGQPSKLSPLGVRASA